MRRLTIVGLVIFFVSTNTKAQQVFKTTSTSTIAYLEYLPADYDKNSDKYPVVFFLHGNGEKGPNSTDPAVLSQYIQNVTRHGPPKYVKNGAQFPFILISPQLKSDNTVWPTAYIMEVINHAKTYLRIDERRIYLTGLSLGGGGVWWAAQDFPALFAAIAPVCGGRNSTSLACGIASENLPVWAFHGDKDTVVPLSRSQTMVNAINACTPTPSPLARLTIYPGVGHNAWDNAYLNDNTMHTPNVYQWMLTQTNVINKGNKIPLANAGADRTIWSSATVSGSGTDSDGTISAYTWKKITGPTVTLTNTSTASLGLTNPPLGKYLFSLTVKDNNGNTDTDYVQVTVTAPPNNPPVANAGLDKSITLPTNSVAISGSATDSDGTIVSYTWTKLSGNAATLVNSNSASLTASGLTEGSYVFRLTVKDDDGASHADDVAVVVKRSVAPVVNAGTDKLVKLPTTSATVIGTATDDGTVVSYLWTKIAGPACSMYNTTTSSLKLSGLVSGVYTFRLSAKDNNGLTGSDDVVVTVNAPPVVNAGVDRTVTLPMKSNLVLAATATDADGTITKFLWSKYSGPNVSVLNSSTSSLTVTAMYEGTYVFKLAVTDNLGLTGYDYVTVVVKAATISTASARSAEVVTPESLAFEETNIFGLNAQEMLDADVHLFDGNGEKIYSGKWSLEKELEVVAPNSVYIYNIVKNGRAFKRGKFLRKNN